MDYERKYIKYKNKYLSVKNQYGKGPDNFLRLDRRILENISTAEGKDERDNRILHNTTLNFRNFIPPSNGYNIMEKL